MVPWVNTRPRGEESSTYSAGYGSKHTSASPMLAWWRPDPGDVLAGQAG